MSAIIERLRKEKKEFETYWFHEGEMNGIDWAKGATYGELQEAIKCTTVSEAVLYLECIQDFIHENDYADIVLEYEDSKRSDALEYYIAGWLTGVNEFWHLIKDLIGNQRTQPQSALLSTINSEN